MIEGVLPGAVVWSESRDDASGAEAKLFPGEEALLARASPKRRREFTAGRSCARQALAQLGVAPGPIPAGDRGSPLWPDGVVGSITHCAGYCAAAVAWADDVVALGIDAEPHQPLPDGILDAVTRPEERAQLDRLALVHPDIRGDRLLFSAKESVYKAWFPLGRRLLDFDDASLTLGLDGSFEARLLVPGPFAGLSGRWLTADGLVLTAITHPANPNLPPVSSLWE